MPQHPNKISQFWQELKRRSVLRSLAIYAGSAFVILEAATIIFPRWGFPDWTIDLVLYLLILGVFITFIISWIFDITPEGIQKTKSADEITETEKPTDSKVWKASTYVSFLVIAGLVVFNILTRGDVLKPGMIQSLAILPFDNYTGDEKLDYVAAGMHTALIGDMGKLGALRVIGKTSSSTYKNTDKSALDIGKELDVQALVEPAVMYYGDSIILQIKVITLYPEEKQLFVEDYMVDNSQVLHLFSKISKRIADEIMIELSPEEERLFAKSKTVDREAYDEYLKARRGDFSRESLYKSLEYLNNAIEKDPDWAPLYSSLASVWMGIQQAGYEPTSVTSPEIYTNLNKALELDPNLSEAHGLIAFIAYLMEWDWEKSEMEYLKALAINPNDAMSRAVYGQLLCTLQRTDEGIAQGRLALELDPLSPTIKVWYGAILLCAGDYKNALALGEEITASDPGHLAGNSLIGAAAFQCKEYDKMIKTKRYFLPMYDVKEEEIKEIERIFNEQGVVMAYEKIMKHLEEYSENNHIGPLYMAMTYMYANQPDKAMDWLEKGFEQHDPKMIYIASIFDFDPLFNNPRFIAICKKMNLPLPNR